VRVTLFDDPDGNGNGYGLHRRARGARGRPSSLMSCHHRWTSPITRRYQPLLLVADTRIINDMDVALNVAHSWVGFSHAHARTRDSVTLMDRRRAGKPGQCGGDNIAAIPGRGRRPAEPGATGNPRLAERQPRAAPAFNGEAMAARGLSSQTTARRTSGLARGLRPT
jgi:hypothetical protein